MVPIASTTFSELRAGPGDLADRGLLVGGAAERDLVGSLPPARSRSQNADMADVMVTAGVDADRGYFYFERTDLFCALAGRQSARRCAARRGLSAPSPARNSRGRGRR